MFITTVEFVIPTGISANEANAEKIAKDNIFYNDSTKKIRLET